MKKILISILVLFLFTFFAEAQKSETLLTIGNKKVSTDEFNHIYKKNNTADIDKKTKEEYLELFINFKLKVVEAETLKLDTAKSFKDELAGYRDQMAKQYMTESAMIDKLAKSAYEKSKIEYKLDHLMIKVDENALPADTLIALKKANSIRDRIVQGEDFEKVARETSDDKSVAKSGGHLWYMSASKLPYKIQMEVSKLKKLEISKPIRTKFGYHIVKLVDSRPAQNQIKVSHIMIACPETLTDAEKLQKKARIDSISARLKAGDDFAKLAVLSDDKGTAKQGGELNWFGTSAMVPEFEIPAYALKTKGEISNPIKTQFGWHIIKLIDTRPLPKYEEDEKSIKGMIENDPDQRTLVQNYVIQNLKKEFKFKEESFPEAFYATIDSSVFKGKWDAAKAEGHNNLLFTINNSKFTEKKFANYIENNQKSAYPIPVPSYVNAKYKDFVFKSFSDIEKMGLEEKNPEFSMLMQEYHDGILLFDLTDQKVWNKALQDSIGLQAFYEKNKTNYKSKMKLDLVMFKYNDNSIYDKAEKIFSKKDKKNFSDEALVDLVNENQPGSFKKLVSGVFEEGENPEADKIFLMITKKEISESQTIIKIADSNLFVRINNRVESDNKQFSDIKGLVIADYQNTLEEEWVSSLRKKYKITVNESVLKKIK